MEPTWDDFAADLQSGDSDRVNGALDRLDGLDLEERATLLDAWFDDLTALYAESDDGYVRQAVVRAVEALNPGMAAAFNRKHDPDAPDTVSALADQTDSVCGFMLTAVTDEDGRVRRAAVRVLRDIYRTYDELEMDDTLDALATELEEMAAEAPETKRKHVQKAAEDAVYLPARGPTRLLEGFR